MTDRDNSAHLQDQVLQASNAGKKLNIVGGGSKAFLGRPGEGATLATGEHRGVIEYDPRELVMTARAGTLLRDIEQLLAENRQMLAFEPPHFGDRATLGGTIACGLSGPRRPFAGAARDFVLGCELLNSKGEILRFGGQVMKNVAGYDVSRLMTGAYGTLGVILGVSLKVLPLPVTSITLFHECSQADAIVFMSSLLSKALPVDGACYYKGQCYIRLSGTKQAINEAQTRIPGAALNPQSNFWHRLREHELSFFNNNQMPLWRIVVKPAIGPLPVEGEWLLDWGGAQRWLRSDVDPATLRNVVKLYGGHATLFRGGDRQGEVFQPLNQPLYALHERLKQSFDPGQVFNRGRMYAGI